VMADEIVPRRNVTVANFHCTYDSIERTDLI
jgi:hypothetical protein